jgi:hypothetical protein
MSTPPDPASSIPPFAETQQAAAAFWQGVDRSRYLDNADDRQETIARIECLERRLRDSKSTAAPGADTIRQVANLVDDMSDIRWTLPPSPREPPFLH